MQKLVLSYSSESDGSELLVFLSPTFIISNYYCKHMLVERPYAPWLQALGDPKAYQFSKVLAARCIANACRIVLVLFTRVVKRMAPEVQI